MSHKINALVFVLLLVAIGTFNVFFHSDNAVSELENKTLQQFPEISLEGIFKEQLAYKMDAFVADQFVFRTPMIELAASIKTLSGFKSEVSIDVVTNENMIGALDENVTGEVFNVGDIAVNYLMFSDRAFAAFDENQAVEAQYAQAINAIHTQLPDLSMYVLLTPTQAAFVDEKFAHLTDDQVASLSRFETLFDADIGYINPYALMQKHFSESLFFRTDHHWNGYGAYLGYVAFAEAIGAEALALGAMHHEDVDGFLGSVYQMTGNANLANNPDTIQMYVPQINVSLNRYKNVDGVLMPVTENIPYTVSKAFLKEKVTYQVFLGGDAPLTVVKNLESPDLPKILVIKDSYGNALVPYLAGHYSEIYAVDPRHYAGDLKMLIRENAIETVLFINSANITRTSGYAELLLQVFE